MKYYLIVGEASGDLHASHLMAALKEEDAQAQFRFFGGDKMLAQGGTLVSHYKDLAYMGFMDVALHLRTILRGMKKCKDDIVAWNPDVVILVDYPGFNLKIARFLHDKTKIPVFYYISPKIWAWKEGRIKEIRRNVNEMFSILPFEVEFYEQKHHYPIHYVGNPTVDEVDAFLKENPADEEGFRKAAGLDNRPIIALLAGSRKQEIRDNLPRMILAASSLIAEYQLVLAAAPGIEDDYYEKCMQEADVKVLRGQTYNILRYATAALVTSGTATLETALFRVPQVVCYYMKAGRLASFARRLMLKIPYISLVNLIADKEVVPELVANEMTVKTTRQHLLSILPGGEAREKQLAGYELMAQRLGEPGAPKRAAQKMHCILAGS
ncbi:MAG: lipid-A-disaccharide synthase [Bacteroidaceae bacterium]|nr:lipid-A-disaccharide synthase [Bacteroidaceae bacterium]